MKTTDDIIEELADGFSKLSGAAHRTLYYDALHALAQMARCEQLVQMQCDFNTAMCIQPKKQLL